MSFHDLFLTFIAFATEVLGTLSGFGSSTFFVPSAVYFESFNLVLALTAILHTFSNLSKLTLFHNKALWPQLLQIALPSILFCGVGAVLSNWLDPLLFKRTLGVALIIISIFLLVFKLKNKIFKLTPLQTHILVSLSGFLTGLVGTGGALRGLLLQSLNLSKDSFILFSAGIDIGGDLLRTVIYTSQGYMDWNQWFYIPMMGAAAIAGAWVGQKLLVYIPQKQFEIIVACGVFMSGGALIWSPG